MAFDLATAQLRATGLQPAEVQVAMDGAVAILEGHLDRGFMPGNYKEKFTDREGHGVVFTHVYPIDGDTVKIDGVKFTNAIDGDQGILFAAEDGRYDFKGRSFLVEYTGGYNPLPADLELVLWSIFDRLAGDMGGAPTISAAGIDSITVPDVGTVRFRAQDSSGATSTSGGPFGPLFETVSSKYRRILC